MRLDLQFVAKEMGWAEFDAGGATLALREVKTFHPSESSICFLVTEIEQEVANLKENNVTFLEDIQEIPGGQGWYASFQDPDGNRLDFYQPPNM